MRTITRFMDARNTAEGKFLSVLLSVLLVFSFLNVTMFTDYAGADPNEASEENSLPVEEPEFTEPEATAEEPEAEKASGEVTTPAPVEEKQEAAVEEEPAATDVEVELQLVDATIAYDGADYGDGDKLVAPLGEDLKFSVKAAEGSKVEASATVDGQDVALAPEADGAYVVKADKVTESLAVIAVVAEAEAEEPGKIIQPEKSVSDGCAVGASVEKALSGSMTYASADFTVEKGKNLKINGAGSLGGQNHKWKSSDKSVAIVSGDGSTGTVTGKSSGKVKITHSYKVWNLWEGDWEEKEETFTVEVTAAKPKTYTLSFNANGGGPTPAKITDLSEGEEVTLPDGLTRSGYVFTGWSTHDDPNATGNFNQVIYAPGTTYTMPANGVTLYAVWSKQNVAADFFIRLDGQIPTEPQDHAASKYSAAINIKGAIKTATFTFSSTEPGVKPNLNRYPTDAQIKGVYPQYNPDTQTVLWYCIKHAGSWHVDGVLLDKSKVNLAYDPNCPAGTWTNMPDGGQYVQGSNAVVSSKVPTRTGYTFKEWNTKADGTGAAYAPSANVKMDENVTLYAQWEANNTTAYKVYHYKQNAKGTYDLADTENLKGKTGNTATATPKVYTGYVLNSTHPDANSEGTIAADGTLKLALYYDLVKDLSYTVNYLEQGTNKVLHEAKTVNGQTFGADVTESAIEIDGYNKVDPVSDSITIGAENNRINFYYTKASFNYTVEYYVDGEFVLNNHLVDANSGLAVPLGGSALYQEQVASPIVPQAVRSSMPLAGSTAQYVLECVNPEVLTISSNQSENVFKVYYETDADGDKTADKYQATVTYKVTNGTWAEGMTEVTQRVTLTKDGQPATAADGGSYTLQAADIPAATANTGYGNGAWTTVPAPEAGATAVSSDATFEYAFTANDQKVTVKWVDEAGNALKPAEETTAKYDSAYDVSGKRAAELTGADGKTYVYDSTAGVVSGTVKSDVEVTFTYSLDEKGGNDPETGEPTQPDGIADKYQATVTYHVANGTFGQGGTTSVAEVVTVAQKNEDGTVTSLDYTMNVPKNMVPAEGYDQQPGAWGEPMPGTETLKGGKSYDYTFTYGINVYSVAVSVANGTSNVGTVGTTGIYGSDLTYAFAPADGYALDGVTVDGRPAVLTDGGYTFSALDANHSISVVYAVDANRDGVPDSRQAVVNYDVANGTWADGTAATVTEYVDMYAYRDGEWEPVEPVLNPPAGMIANAGYSQASGSWRVNPAASQLVAGGEVTFTYAFTAIPTVVVPPTTPVVPTAPVVTPAAVTPAPTPAAPAAPAPAAPAPAAAPAAAAPVPAAEPIEDDATPQAAAAAERTPLAETEEIEDEATPMGAFDEPHCWVHWVMLLGILITAAYGLVVVRRRLHLADDVDDYEKQVLGIEDEAPEAVPADGRQAL